MEVGPKLKHHPGLYLLGDLQIQRTVYNAN